MGAKARGGPGTRALLGSQKCARPHTARAPRALTCMHSARGGCSQDAKTAEWVQLYAANSPRFFKDFAAAYGKLLALGTTPAPEPTDTPSERASERTRRDAADAALAADMATAITTTSAMGSSF